MERKKNTLCCSSQGQDGLVKKLTYRAHFLLFRLDLLHATTPLLWYLNYERFLSRQFNCRLLHHRLLYKHMHKIHHEWQAPIAMAANYAHPIEHILTGKPICKFH